MISLSNSQVICEQLLLRTLCELLVPPLPVSLADSCVEYLFG
jgi:hypothetical protein